MLVLLRRVEKVAARKLVLHTVNDCCLDVMIHYKVFCTAIWCQYIKCHVCWKKFLNAVVLKNANAVDIPLFRTLGLWPRMRRKGLLRRRNVPKIVDQRQICDCSCSISSGMEPGWLAPTAVYTRKKPPLSLSPVATSLLCLVVNFNLIAALRFRCEHVVNYKCPC